MPTALKKKQKTKNRKIAGIVLAVGLVVSGGLFALSYATAETVLPGVAINGISVAGLRRAEARMTVVQSLAQRSITLTYAGRGWTATPGDLGLQYDINTAVDVALVQGRNVVSLVNGSDVQAPVTVDAVGLADFLKQIGTEALAAPVNAALAIEDGTFGVQPEQVGQQFDFVDAREQLLRNTTNVKLAVITARPTIVASDLVPLLERANQLAMHPVTLVIEKTRIEVPVETIKTWITAENNNGVRVTIDETKLGAFLQSAAKVVAVAPVPQRVIKSEQRIEVMSEGRPGKQLSLPEAVATVKNYILDGQSGKVSLALTEVPRSIEYADAPPAPQPIGKVIGVDLTHQHAYVYQDSRLIYSLKISSGINDWTPTGTFHVYAKTKKQKMSGPDYYVPNVPNILWFKGDYSMHGVYWHEDFGIRPRSHGCVGQSVADSEWTYNFSEVGMPIVIYKS